MALPGASEDTGHTIYYEVWIGIGTGSGQLPGITASRRLLITMCSQMLKA